MTTRTRSPERADQALVSAVRRYHFHYGVPHTGRVTFRAVSSVSTMGTPRQRQPTPSLDTYSFPPDPRGANHLPRRGRT
jgi:hypothetical protein